MITIDDESRQRVRIAIDIDNMSQRYITSSNIFTFTSPSLWTLEKNLYYLLRNSTEIEFDLKYKWKPDYFSYDEYGTVVLAPILMYVNNVYCIEDFDLVTIIVPSLSSIINICQDKFPKEDVSQLTSVDW